MAAQVIVEMQQRGDGVPQMFEWRTFRVALAVVTLVMVAAWSSFFPPFYMENDDVTIRMALEGRAAPGQPPTGFALMTNAALGWLLVAMESVLPSVSWWDVVLAATLLWALAVLLALAWDALGSGWLARSTVVGALLLATAPLVASFQFTISATLCGGAAALLALSELSAVRPRRSVLVMAMFLFGAGLLVRPMGGPAGAVFAAFLSLPSVRSGRSALVRSLGVVGIVCISFIAAQYVDGVLYGLDREWDTYYRYNAIVGPLMEWGHDLSVQYAREIHESVGWSFNDWAMLAAALGVDPAVHGLDRVNQAYQTQSAIAERVGLTSLMLARLTRAPATSLLDLLSGIALLAVAGGALVAACGTRRGAAGALAVFVIFCAMCFGVELTFAKLPWRLLGPLQVLLMAALVITVGAWRRPTSPLCGVLALGVILALAAPTAFAAAEEAAGRRKRALEIANEEVVALQRLSPALVIFHSSTFPREYWWRPFAPPPARLPAIALGWNNHNPQVQRFLTDTGRQPLLRALCTVPSMIIVAEKRTLEVVTEYLKEHFNTSVRWTQVYAGSFPAWRCSAVNGTESEIRQRSARSMPTGWTRRSVRDAPTARGVTRTSRTRGRQ